ncbi:MAG: PAS domain-containing sensor histidine kinase [Candidatus Thermoplasmatota archaeon]
MFLALEIILMSFITTFKTQNVTFLFFTISVICFALTGHSHQQGYGYLAVFSGFISYLFLGLIFITLSPKKEESGLSSFFTLKKRLENTEKKLHRSEEKYRTIVENTNDVIIVSRPNEGISYVSPSYSNIFDSKKSNNESEWPYTIHPKDQEKVNKEIKKGFIGISGEKLKYRITTENDEIKWVSHSWIPIEDDGKVQMVVNIIRDVTPEKKLEKRLKDKINELEKNEQANLNILEDFQDTIESLELARQQIEDKNIELEISQERLKNLNNELERRVKKRTEKIEKLLKQKNDFINMLGHDLKNPLVPLTTLTPLLREKLKEDKDKEMVDVIVRNIKYMKTLVQKTLELARLNSSSTKLNFERLNLSKEVDKVIDENETILKEDDIQIDKNIDTDLWVKADELRLNELFKNLLTNAVKYSKQGDKLNIDASIEDKKVKVAISDNGEGMTEEQVNHIFDEFYKADEARSNFDSSGLGLPICKTIVEKHGGQIWAESEGPGQGSTFYFTLPNAKTEKFVEK